MFEICIEVLGHSVMITGFIFAMMLVIEYFNITSSGKWHNLFLKFQWGGYILGALLGVIPGCLGAFVAVSMYTHRILTFGALTSAMIATIGDEAFALLALSPENAVYIFSFLFVMAVLFGWLSDLVFLRFHSASVSCEGYEYHSEDHTCSVFSKKHFLSQWKNCTMYRGLISLFLLIFSMLILSGKIGHEEAWWMSATILAISILSFLIVLSVPDHFLEKHLWNHVFKKHVPKIFLWAFAALFITHLLIHDIKMENMVLNAKWSVLFLAAIAGLIPQSGPHLIFVTLFAKGLLPFSVLLANSIVQDGHGTLPLLAHSRKDFIVIKTVKLVISLFICSVLMLMGF